MSYSRVSGKYFYGNGDFYYIDGFITNLWGGGNYYAGQKILWNYSPIDGFKDESDELDNSSAIPIGNANSDAKKGPLSFLSGSITSLSFSFLSLFISKKIVLYFSMHTPNYSSPIAQSIASGFKTLIIGISFLATFTFGFIGLGLFLVFIRSLIEGKKEKTD